MSAPKPIAAALGVLAAALAVAAAAGGENSAQASAAAARAAGDLPPGNERVNLDPADSTPRTANPYWPMRPGSRWIYRETDSEGTKQRVVVTVTPKTKRIANGITARGVPDGV